MTTERDYFKYKATFDILWCISRNDADFQLSFLMKCFYNTALLTSFNTDYSDLGQKPGFDRDENVALRNHSKVDSHQTF